MAVHHLQVLLARAWRTQGTRHATSLTSQGCTGTGPVGGCDWLVCLTVHSQRFLTVNPCAYTGPVEPRGCPRPPPARVSQYESRQERWTFCPRPIPER